MVTAQGKYIETKKAMALLARNLKWHEIAGDKEKRVRCCLTCRIHEVVTNAVPVTSAVGIV